MKLSPLPTKLSRKEWLTVLGFILILGGLIYYFRVALPRERVEAQIKAEAATAKLTGKSFENSLGMVFVPAGTDNVLFCIWDVRVKDFKAFVDAAGYDATSGMYTFGSDGWKQNGDTWKSPGFAQTENDPVVGVNWNDAKAFCQWLTKREQSEGKLTSNQEYRLPTDAEWSKAVGLNESNDGIPADKDGRIKDVYPWGTQWPPPRGAGNFWGEESFGKFSIPGHVDRYWDAAEEHPGDYISKTVIAGYNDGYVQTSPVGSFSANRYGLYDMSGNVSQWCEDKFDNEHDWRVLRGGSWLSPFTNDLWSSSRSFDPPDKRDGVDGFRCVLAASH